MGGRGSGRRWRWDVKETVAAYRRIDGRDWQRRGPLRPGARFSWAWWRDDGETVASISVTVWPQHVVLAYRYRQGDGEWQYIDERVSLSWTPCHYGGQRPWFVCPGVVNGRVCGRQVALLYLGGRYFLCRHCYDLVYPSTRDDAATRLMSKAQAIRERLGGSPSLRRPYPPKPPRMHWRTYWRLREEAEEAETAAWVAIGERLLGAEALLAELESQR